MNVSTTLFRVFSIETLKNVVKILFLLVSLAILLAFHVIACDCPTASKELLVSGSHAT
jgi:flagellar biosynthesis protein FlhB